MLQFRLDTSYFALDMVKSSKYPIQVSFIMMQGLMYIHSASLAIKVLTSSVPALI